MAIKIIKCLLDKDLNIFFTVFALVLSFGMIHFTN